MVVFLLDFGGDPHYNQDERIFHKILYICQFVQFFAFSVKRLQCMHKNYC